MELMHRFARVTVRKFGMRYLAHGFGISAGTLALILLLSASAPAAFIQSTFDTDRDGWLVRDLPSPTPGAPPPILGTFTPTFNSTGGNPGGHISITDATANVMYWYAPSKFLGNQGAAYGGSLSFDLAQNSTDSQFDQEDEILVGADITLVFNTLSNPGTSFTHYDVGLTEAGWKRNSLSGAAASQADMQAVLSSLTDLYIRAEY